MKINIKKVCYMVSVILVFSITIGVFSLDIYNTEYLTDLYHCKHGIDFGGANLGRCPINITHNHIDLSYNMSFFCNSMTTIYSSGGILHGNQ